jgi:hypothetical protein
VTDGFAYRLLARSRTALAHVPTGLPLRAAAASYAALRAGFSRSSSRSVSGSSLGGLPLPRFGASGLVIAGLWVRTNICATPLTLWLHGHILSVQ